MSTAPSCTDPDFVVGGAVWSHCLSADTRSHRIDLRLNREGSFCLLGPWAGLRQASQQGGCCLPALPSREKAGAWRGGDPPGLGLGPAAVGEGPAMGRKLRQPEQVAGVPLGFFQLDSWDFMMFMRSQGLLWAHPPSHGHRVNPSADSGGAPSRVIPNAPKPGVSSGLSGHSLLPQFDHLQ